MNRVSASPSRSWSPKHSRKPMPGRCMAEGPGFEPGLTESDGGVGRSACPSWGGRGLRFRLMVDVVRVGQPHASWEERSMKHYAGLDVSIKETSICLVDEAGRICREMKVVSHPEDLLAVLCDPAWRLERVGLEAGPLSQWLFSGLAEAGVSVICIETRHAKAFLKAQVNKSDRNDARGIAQMMRVGFSKPGHA